MNWRVSLRNILGGAIFFAGFGLVICSTAEPAGQSYYLADDRFSFFIFGFGLMLLGAIVLSGSLACQLARPFTGLIDLIYFGSNTQEAPPVTLRLAQAYRQAGRHQEAIAECERQLEMHPGSLELWREVIANARCIGSGEKAADYFHRATRRLRGEDRSMLEREFPALSV